jgi:hypothetical protein
MSSISAHLSTPAVNRRVAPIAAAGLLGVAVVHLIDGPNSLSGMTYIGIPELALAAASVPLAVMLLVRPVTVLWRAAGGLILLALLCYLASRTIGLPGSTADIGNWFQTLGVVNLVVEVLVLAAVVSGLRPGKAP